MSKVSCKPHGIESLKAKEFWYNLQLTRSLYFTLIQLLVPD